MPAFTIDDRKDLTFNQLLGINNEGTIAGYFGIGGTNAQHPNKGYTVTPNYAQGNFKDENFPNSVQTQVTGINDNDLTVGFYINANGNNIGFVEHDGKFASVYDPAGAPLATSSNGTPSTEQLLGVNDFDVAAGFYTDANGQNHGFTYDIVHGTFHAVNVSGFTNVMATGIDNFGDIVGTGTDAQGRTEGFVMNSHGAVHELTGPAGAVSVSALGINDFGEVVGSWTDAQKNSHGFEYNASNGKYTTYNFGNGFGTVINGVNDKNELVGFYTDAQNNTNGVLVIPGTTGPQVYGHHW